MSIVTKGGDSGTTGLMYRRRLSKTDPRVEACGTLDELNSALGLVRAAGGEAFLSDTILGAQKDLIAAMGELATLPDDAAQYARDGYARLADADVARLDEIIRRVEPLLPAFRDWVLPGGTKSSAALDFARTVCRRAERQAWSLIDSGAVGNAIIGVYLNRLADLLWLLARWVEAGSAMV